MQVVIFKEMCTKIFNLYYYTNANYLSTVAMFTTHLYN